MTNPKPTPEQIQRANALAQKVLRAEHWEIPLADTIAELDAKDVEIAALQKHAAAAEQRVAAEKARAGRLIVKD